MTYARSLSSLCSLLFLTALLRAAVLMLIANGASLAATKQPSVAAESPLLLNEQGITTAIADYLEGTSYSREAQIRRAFHPNASLFLTLPPGGTRALSIDEYASWFKKTPGQFTGRLGNLISLHIDGDIATAKAEVLLPKDSVRFVDLFLLKKMDGAWQIISKTARRETAPAHGRKVLFVLSNASHMPGTQISAGNSFSELARAYARFRAAGYSVHAISPEGGAAPLAYIDTSDPLQKTYLYNADFMDMLARTRSAAQVNAADYAAVFYIGGNAAMFGVADNASIQKIALSIYEEHGGVVAAVCHGSAGIVNLMLADGIPLIAGKRVTGYPDAFENKREPYYRTFPFSIEKRIAERKGKFSYGKRGSSHIEVDGRLITGMNFQSTADTADAVIRQIEARYARKVFEAIGSDTKQWQVGAGHNDALSHAVADPAHCAFMRGVGTAPQ